MIPISNALTTLTSKGNIFQTNRNFKTRFFALKRGEKVLQNQLNFIFFPRTSPYSLNIAYIVSLCNIAPRVLVKIIFSCNVVDTVFCSDLYRCVPEFI